MTKFIVIAGKKQHGKNTVASMLKELLEKDGKTVEITAFAAPLKRFCNDIFGIPLEDMETEEGKKKLTHITWESLYRPAVIQDWVDDKKGPLTVRELLQYFGTNICRNRFYQPIWASAPFRKEYLRFAFEMQYLCDCPSGMCVKACPKRSAGIHKIYTDYVIIADCRFKNELAEARKNNAIVFYVDRGDYLKGDNHISERDLDDVNWNTQETMFNNGTLDTLKEICELMYEKEIKPGLVI